MCVIDGMETAVYDVGWQNCQVNDVWWMELWWAAKWWVVHGGVD